MATSREPEHSESSADLSIMVSTTGSCSKYSYMAMAAGYGNYCGFGGRGQPMDEIDECCYAHDACWAAINYRWAAFKSYNWGYPKSK